MREPWWHLGGENRRRREFLQRRWQSLCLNEHRRYFGASRPPDLPQTRDMSQGLQTFMNAFYARSRGVCCCRTRSHLSYSDGCSTSSAEGHGDYLAVDCDEREAKTGPLELL